MRAIVGNYFPSVCYFVPKQIKHGIAFIPANIKCFWELDHLEEAYRIVKQLYFTLIPEVVKIPDSKHSWMHSLFKSCCLQMCIKDHFVCRIPSTSETSVKKSCETIRNTSFTLSRPPKFLFHLVQMLFNVLCYITSIL